MQAFFLLLLGGMKNYSTEIVRAIEQSAWGALCAEYPPGTRRVACNWRIRRGELDAVLMQPDGVLVSVEIRFRAGEEFGGALESIGPRKWMSWMAATRVFAERLSREPVEIRMDLWWNDGQGWSVTSALDG